MIRSSFHPLYNKIKQLFRIGPFDNAKLLADAAYDATDIYKELHYDGIKPVIATNGHRFRKSLAPKTKTTVRDGQQRGYSFKEVFGLAKMDS